MKARQLLALFLPFLACALQWLLWDDWIKPYVWFFFFPAAFFGAWLGGMLGGVLSTLIGAGLAWYFFIPAPRSFVLDSPAAAFSIGLFVVMGLLYALIFERLRRAQALDRTGFDALFEQAAVGFAMVAPDGRWLRANRKLCEIVAYPREELLARTFQEITHPDDLAADLDNVRRMLAGEIASYAMEKRYLRKNGETVWINLTVGLIWKTDRTPDYFVSVVEDISARKASEAALAANTERLREANRLAHLGHWQWEIASNRQQWSDEVFAIYGRDPQLPPAGYPEMQQYFTPASWQTLSGAVEKCRTQGAPYECDAEVLRANGEHRWIVARGQAVRDGDGRITALYGTVQDVTARKLAEDVIRQRNAELERFNQASIGRELKMIELKRQVNALAQRLGEAAPYALSAIDAAESESAR